MSKDLFEKVLRITGWEKKNRAVNIVWWKFVKMKQKESLLSLKGNIKFKGGENE